MVTLKRTVRDDADFQLLVKALDEELWNRYPGIQHKFTPHNTLDPAVRVVIALMEGYPIGCGCFRKTDERGTLEIKRMYVHPAHRGQRIAGMILKALEAWGWEEGFVSAILETGIDQPEAIAVYTRSGYQQIPNYAPYDTITESICLAKNIRDNLPLI
jgi:GNAT superfamily N-acetyltransferase